MPPTPLSERPIGLNWRGVPAVRQTSRAFYGLTDELITAARLFSNAKPENYEERRKRVMRAYERIGEAVHQMDELKQKNLGVTP